jgi:glutathione S-transferase
MPNVVLHQWEISPFCGKIRKILTIKGIAHTVVGYNGLKATRAAKLSPVGKLPVLDYDGERIQDSSAIAAFLERKHPSPPLYPDDAADLARCRILEDWADESLYWYEVYFRFNMPDSARQAIDLLSAGRPAWERWLVDLVARRDIAKRLRGQGLGRMPMMRVEEQFFGLLNDIEALLSASDWLAGPRISMADISASAQLDEMCRTSHVRDRIMASPKVRAWLARS